MNEDRGHSSFRIHHSSFRSHHFLQGFDMRHRVAHRKLGRKTEHRLALLRNLCTSLITHERLITTLPKAKELRPFAERAITLGKRALAADAPQRALHNRRLAAAYFFSGNTNRVPDGGYKRPHAPRTAGVAALDKLFDEVAARFVERPGGYTRILKLGTRKGDGAEMALIELLGSEAKEAHKDEKTEEKKKGRRFFGRRKKAELKEGVPQEQPIRKKGASAKSSKKKEGIPQEQPEKKGASTKASKRKETSE
jgi:large subunit ribosomal protein L17